MADPYPWGTQAPTKRVAALDAQIVSNEGKKADAIKRHRDEIKKFDETDRSLRADLRAAQAIVDKEKSEADAAAATRVLMKLLSSTGMDVGEAVKSGVFEKAMQEAFNKVEGKSSKGSSPAKAPASSKEASGSEGGDES